MGWAGSAGAVRRGCRLGLGVVSWSVDVAPIEGESTTVRPRRGEGRSAITAARSGSIARLARRLDLETASEFPAGPKASGRSGDRFLR